MTAYELHDDLWTRSVTNPLLPEPIEVLINAHEGTDGPTPRQSLVAEIAITNLLTCKPTMDSLARKYCRIIDSAVDLAGDGIAIDYKNIGNHYKIVDIFVGFVDECRGMYYFYTCEWCWDEAYGLQFLLDGDSILSCGPFSNSAPGAKTDADYARIATKSNGSYG